MVFEGANFKAYPGRTEAGLLPILVADLSIDYGPGKLASRVYIPKEKPYIKRALIHTLGTFGALDEIDNGIIFGDNYDQPARSQAQRGSLVFTFNNPNHGIRRISDGKFTEENELEAIVASNKALKGEGFGKIYAMGHSSGTYFEILSITKKGQEYVAIAGLNPMLYYKGVYKENPFGNILIFAMYIIRTAGNKPIKKKFGDFVIKFINTQFEREPVIDSLGYLKVEDGFWQLNESLKCPRLYKAVKGLKTPVMIRQCADDELLYHKSKKNQRKLENKLAKWGTIINKGYLDFELIGEIGKGPNHTFSQQDISKGAKKLFSGPEFDHTMVEFNQFFEQH